MTSKSDAYCANVRWMLKVSQGGTLTGRDQHSCAVRFITHVTRIEDPSLLPDDPAKTDSLQYTANPIPPDRDEHQNLRSLVTRARLSMVPQQRRERGRERRLVTKPRLDVRQGYLPVANPSSEHF